MFRNCCFTLNNYTEDDVNKIQSAPHKYLIIGREIGESGTPHLQGYIELEKRMRQNAVKKLLGARTHFESRKGTAQQAADYCKKDNDYTESGTISQPGKRNDLIAFVDAIKANPKKRKLHIMEEFPQVYAKYPKFCNEYRLLKQDWITLNYTETPNLWVYGPVGVGKSREFQELGDLVYSKMPNKWWDGYDGQHTVLIEDIEPNHRVLGYHIKIWGDRYPFIAEFKGFAHKIRPPRIVITSNFHPNQIWEGEVLNAVLRRFKLREVGV
jgi:hypothetical protein